MNIAFFGSSLVSSYRNGSATYYRGLLSNLARRGHRITFYEPDDAERQAHREVDDPAWARVVVYSGSEPDGVLRCLEHASAADLVVKASGVGVFDDLLEREVLSVRNAYTSVVFWDMDAPATLERLAVDPADHLPALVPHFDFVFTTGGGERAVQGYRELGARGCLPIHAAVDPATHHPVAPDPRFAATLGLLANRIPDREQRVRELFFDPAASLDREVFLLAGHGWDEGAAAPANVRVIGHVPAEDHNAFNCTPRAVLNVTRESMARYGSSPSARIFEAAGAGACVISDAWDGIEAFLEPGNEVLCAEDGDQVASILEFLEPEHAAAIGQAARERVLAEHTYAHRAAQFDAVIQGLDREAPAEVSHVL
jgi:spore maturation protein CgeB